MSNRRDKRATDLRAKSITVKVALCFRAAVTAVTPRAPIELPFQKKNIINKNEQSVLLSNEGKTAQDKSILLRVQLHRRASAMADASVDSIARSVYWLA